MSRARLRDDDSQKQYAFTDSLKVIISGACAVVIGLAWKDYIMNNLERLQPFLQTKLKINSHILSFVFMVALTLVLALIIHWQQKQ